MRLWVCSAVWVALTTGCASTFEGPLNTPDSARSSEQPAAWVANAIAGDGPGDRAPSGVAAPLQVQNLPKSSRGNPSEYTVGGERYAVLDSAQGFVEHGKASWYGRKFHGRETSSGEVYDMYELTAAHKHLPIPTFVQVTRTDTGDSIVVKVNDRGPFVPGRIIDLSYQAAATLGILESGTAPVIVEALSSHLPSDTLKTVAAPAPSDTLTPAAVPADASNQGAAQNSVAQNLPTYVSGNYLQLGAFSQVSNAQSLIGKLATDTPTPLLINHDAARELYRVWVGPFDTAEEHDAAVIALQTQGVVNFTMVPSGRQ